MRKEKKGSYHFSSNGGFDLLRVAIMATFSTAGTLVIKTVKRVSNIHLPYHSLHILLVNPIQPYSLIPMGISHGAVTI